MKPLSRESLPQEQSYGSPERFDQDRQAGNPTEFAAILRRISHRKGLISGITLGITAMAGLASLVLPNTYESRGFLRAGMSAATYQKVAPSLNDASRFLKFLDGAGFPVDEFPGLRTRLANGDTRILEQMLDLAYDGKAGGPTASPPSVIGLWVTSEGRSPELAQKLAIAVGDYVRDCLLRNAILEYITAGNVQALTQKSQQETEAHDAMVTAAVLTSKRETMRKMEKDYPQSPTIYYQPLARTQGSSNGELPAPAIEMVKVDLDLADAKTQLIRLEKDVEEDQVELAFLQKATIFLDRDQSGRELFEKLAALEETFFKGHASNENAPNQKVLSQVEAQLASFRVNYVEPYGAVRFEAWPTISKQHVKPSRGLILLDALLLSLVGTCWLALLLG